MHDPHGVPFDPLRDARRRTLGPGFPHRVHALVRTVPAGAVTTYGDVARALGSARAARQVGSALGALPRDSDVPWWRVVAAGGRIATREPAAMRRQAAALAREGVEVRRTLVVAFAARHFVF